METKIIYSKVVCGDCKELSELYVKIKKCGGIAEYSLDVGEAMICRGDAHIEVSCRRCGQRTFPRGSGLKRFEAWIPGTN